jgi:hypothetical protein
MPLPSTRSSRLKRNTALIALYFAVNNNKPNPRVYMLNPHALNELTTGGEYDYLNYPLSWVRGGKENIRLAWEERNPRVGYDLPIAIPGIYQDQRMIAQKSCFTIHGRILKPLNKLLKRKGCNIRDYLIEYPIVATKSKEITNELRVLGISQSTIFPDLDNLSKDLEYMIENF